MGSQCMRTRPGTRQYGHATLLATLFATLSATLLAPVVAAQIYKVTDEENGVVFTDRPTSVNGNTARTVEELDLPDTNMVPHTTVRPPPPVTLERREEPAVTPSVSVASPANESTVAMGPGNFAVSARAEPPLSRDERLLLLMDGQPVGEPQASSSWFIEGALRGAHDLLVQRTNTRGTSIAISEPVRVYVLRPSLIGR
ncbi:MAG: hypothetical protein ACI87W_002185 [Halieaceae bacterium]|jgi:hypothetical protein